MSKASKYERKAREAVAECRLASDTKKNGWCDSERAHVYEDLAYQYALKAIVAGCRDPGKLAAHVLELSELKFSRWYA